MHQILLDCSCENNNDDDAVSPTSSTSWTLWAVESSSDESQSSSQLGHLLTNPLIRVLTTSASKSLPQSTLTSSAPAVPVVVFLGMDSPQLNLDELHKAMVDRDAAHLCPSVDGGYGLLSLPPHIVLLAESCFQGVLWSHPLTALSQLKALTDAGVAVKLGRLMYDVDEPDDVMALCRRLQGTESLFDDGDHISRSNCLLRTSGPPVTQDGESSIADNTTSDCPQTRQALILLGLVVQGD
jgi:glycosyltransferase A (GT-A) superfamily protein (DUF2064 family)